MLYKVLAYPTVDVCTPCNQVLTQAKTLLSQNATEVFYCFFKININILTFNIKP